MRRIKYLGSKESVRELYENKESLLKYIAQLKELMEPNTTDQFPRRNRMDLWTPAEKAIQEAVNEVEKAGADVRLTDAVILLQQAKNKVADFVDGK
jgi:hypothetical protein